MKQGIRYSQHPGARPDHMFDLADHVDIVNFFMSGNIVDTMLFATFDATDDDVAEVAGIQRLAHVATMPRNWKHRHLLHEAGQPAQVLAVKPAEHQSWP